MQEDLNVAYHDILIYGKAAVQTAFKSRPRAIKKLFLDKSNNAEFSELCSWLARERRPYETVGRDELAQLAGTRKHEGVVALTQRPIPASVKPAMRNEWAAAGEKILFADGNLPPEELANIARLAVICGISRLILSEESVDSIMTTEAWSLSLGALDCLKIYVTESMQNLVRMMGESYFVVGMVREGGRRVDYGKAISFPGKTVALYVSADPNGVPAEMISRCHYLLHIPEQNNCPIRYSPSDLVSHFLPWINAKIKKPGAGFLMRKKSREVSQGEK